MIVGKCWSELGKYWSELGKEWSVLGKEWSVLGKEWSVFGKEWSVLGIEWCVSNTGMWAGRKRVGPCRTGGPGGRELRPAGTGRGGLGGPTWEMKRFGGGAW